MRHLLLIAALLSGGAAVAQGRAALGEVWVYPVMFQQALTPLAPLSGRVARENLCPTLPIGADKVIYTYSVDVKMKSRGVEEKRWEVTDLRLVNPSGCQVLDAEFAQLMRDAIPQFAEPRKDLDGNGWTRIPKIQLKVVD